MASLETIKTLRNKSASVAIDLHGGGIHDFRLTTAGSVNPLSFAFGIDDMPQNNRNGAPYRGHFLCLGRWGAPSQGEREAGLPDHGQAANLMWEEDLRTARQLDMAVDCPLEGLYVKRGIRLDERAAAFAVEETVSNTAPLGRLYNMVQHPTLGRPFIDGQLKLNCNATLGFDQFVDTSPDADPLHWPYGRLKASQTKRLDLGNPSEPYNSVFSFIVDPTDDFGFITAYSPSHNLLLGYVWPRKDYPWIHFWQDWDTDGLRFLGMEFGTAGFHRPFPELLAGGLELFKERTTAYLDAGSQRTRRFIGFLHEPNNMEPITKVQVIDGGSQIALVQRDRKSIIETDFSKFLR